MSKTFSVDIGFDHFYVRYVFPPVHYTQSTFRPTVRELDTLIVDAMGKDSRVIREAEDTDADFIIEFLPIKKKGIEPRFFIAHDISDMTTLFVRLGAHILNEMYALADKHFGSETGFGFDVSLKVCSLKVPTSSVATLTEVRMHSARLPSW